MGGARNNRTEQIYIKSNSRVGCKMELLSTYFLIRKVSFISVIPILSKFKLAKLIKF